ncbi:MAG: ABC transporter ATP-binding protein [Acidobacteriota bacterium]
MTADPGGGAADGAVSTRDSFLELRGLAKSFGDTRVLEDFTLGLGEGEILALLGLSGSGKTTALRLLAGFETPDEGTVRVGGQDVTALSPAARGFGMVFQHYALFPHMSVEQNIAFGLEAQGWDKGRIAPRVDEMLALVHLEGFGSRRVSEISGGQQQRVALGRALAPEPRLLLLDEPLSNLDPALRERTRQELRAAVRRVGITTVLVTHEQEEAFHVGDRVAVLNAGRLEQVGLPQELYRAPTSPFVATFIGRSGTLRGTLEAVDDLGAARVRLGDALWHGRARGPSAQVLARGAAVDFVVRPESLRLTEPQTPDALAGRVADHRFTGAATFAVIDLAVGGRVLVSSDDTEVGAVVHVVPALDGTARGGTAPSGHGPEPSVFPAGDPT